MSSAALELPLPCLRCGGGVRAETAVALVIEVIDGDGGDPSTWRVLERRVFFHLHPSCARVKRGIIETNTRKRFKDREGWFLAVASLPIDPGRPWAVQ